MRQRGRASLQCPSASRAATVLVREVLPTRRRGPLRTTVASAVSAGSEKRPDPHRGRPRGVRCSAISTAGCPGLSLETPRRPRIGRRQKSGGERSRSGSESPYGGLIPPVPGVPPGQPSKTRTAQTGTVPTEPAGIRDPGRPLGGTPPRGVPRAPLSPTTRARSDGTPARTGDGHEPFRKTREALPTRRPARTAKRRPPRGPHGRRIRQVRGERVRLTPTHGSHQGTADVLSLRPLVRTHHAASRPRTRQSRNTTQDSFVGSCRPESGPVSENRSVLTVPYERLLRAVPPRGSRHAQSGRISPATGENSAPKSNPATTGRWSDPKSAPTDARVARRPPANST